MVIIMGLIFQQRKHFKNRLPIGVVIVLFSCFPYVLGILGTVWQNFFRDNPCHGSECTWMTLTWFALITMPIGFLVLMLFLSIAIFDLYWLNKKPDSR